MRLLNASILEFEDFTGDSIPSYAILSHTWGKEEVTLQDFELCREKSKLGYQKILNTCRQALADDLKYAWIDTCCIDKRSSAELSEAINSMFNWYARSSVCYAYLEDASNFNLQNEKDAEHFGKCRWYSRGWTLQELIAPPEVIFYSKDWIAFGKRQSVTNLLSEITGIDADLLKNPAPEKFFGFSIAKRMSWASKRETTRVEDMSYCLLGLFDVHIPLLYGEGDKAFLRLQEEIVKQYYDHSIFAWGQISDNSTRKFSYANIIRTGLLACSPSMFRYSNKIISFRPQEAFPYTFTNLGLGIELSTIDSIALLNCHLPNDLHHQLAIYIVKIGNQHYRCDNILYLVDRRKGEDSKAPNEYLKSDIMRFPNSAPPVGYENTGDGSYTIHVPRGNNYRIFRAEPSSLWSADRHAITLFPLVLPLVTLYLELKMFVNQEMLRIPEVVIYIGCHTRPQPPYYSYDPGLPTTTWCSIHREGHESSQDIPDVRSAATSKHAYLEETENEVEYGLFIEVVTDEVMGQIMEVLHIDVWMTVSPCFRDDGDLWYN